VPRGEHPVADVPRPPFFRTRLFLIMTKLFGFLGATVGGAIGWWLGDYVGIMTAVILSMVGTGVGIYYGKRYGDHLSGG